MDETSGWKLSKNETDGDQREKEKSRKWETIRLDDANDEKEINKVIL